MADILCVNGPNLDMLGRRQPEFYGSTTLPELETTVVAWGKLLGLEVECFQSNREGELIEALHGASGTGVILNPGAFTHTSSALHDAVVSIEVPVVEVHLSNVRRRERWRRRSLISPATEATIFGRGIEGYRSALRHFINRRRHGVATIRYGPHPDQVIDVRAGSVTGVGVVLIHGGFWDDAWGRDTTESWAVDLATEGISTANVEYRRLGSGGGPTPTTSDAAEAVLAAAAALGTDRLALVGHSAGAQLAIWSAVNGFLLPLVVVSVSGVLDLDAAAAEGLGGGLASGFAAHPEMSPSRLSPPAAPVYLVHGTDDDVVPSRQSEGYAGYLSSRGLNPEMAFIADAGHFDVLSPDSRAWTTVRKALAEAGVLST